ncbi:phosphorylase b kinase regulatory subunit beta-like isoform X2 [Apostichopus japonicus]
MRGILYCYMRQSRNLEAFKFDQKEEHALHSKYNVMSGDLSPDAHHQLQLDAVAIFVLYLVQMISSGLQIIYNLDEVSFVQNLIYYMERAYRVPDYGIWERGSKYNTGKPELHASSIGMVKAALEACRGFNFFGKDGASWSVTYVDPDSSNRNKTTLESLLPRESSSKNTDASLLAVISFPAFAVENKELVERTQAKVIRHLKGSYGFRRFRRDGYGTVLEDTNRQFYQPTEIKSFEGVENEWPLFYIYMMLDGLATGKKEQVDEYYRYLKPLLKKGKYGIYVPKYYFVPKSKIERERSQPGSQERTSSGEDGEKSLFLWGQSLFIIAMLLREKLITIDEIDPVGRHIGTRNRTVYRPNTRHSAFENIAKDMTVQMVFITESARLQSTLATYGIQTQTPSQLEPIQIWSPRQLIKLLERLGQNPRLGLTGRPPRPIGSIGTAKLYRVFGNTVLCYPLQFELTDFYMYQDLALLIDDVKNLVGLVRNAWTMSGRPTFCILLREEHFEDSSCDKMLKMLSAFKRGVFNGIRVKIGRLNTLVPASYVEHLDFRIPNESTPLTFTPLQDNDGGVSPARTVRRRLSSSLSSAEDDEEDFDIKHYKSRPTYELHQQYHSIKRLLSQAEMLALMSERDGLHFELDGATLQERLEAVAVKARIQKEWSTQRYVASILRKAVDSLAPSITTMLVRGKFVSVGVFGHEEKVFMKPVSPGELLDTIFNLCQPHDIYEPVIHQEVIIALSKLISSKPKLFDGILKIRVGWLIQAMKMELRHSWRMKDLIHSLPPSQLTQLLTFVLEVNMADLDDRTWLQKRQFMGALNKCPAGFYDKVWMILGRTPGGFIIANQYLPQQPTLSDMTKTDLNFALKIEEMFCRIAHSEYRQVIVELLFVVATILGRNPELQFQHTVNMDSLVHEAFNLFLSEEGLEKQDDMTPFYNSPPHGIKGTSNYLTKVAVKHLLNSPIVQGDHACKIS